MAASGARSRLGELGEDGAALRMLHLVSGIQRVGSETTEAGATVIAPEGRVEASEGADVLDIRIMPEG